MKLEGDLAFYHSNSGQPESQSFEFNDNDLDAAAAYKLQNQKLKEYENRVSFDLKRQEGDLDLSPYDLKSADRRITQKLDFSNCMIGLKNDYEAQIWDSVEPLSLSAQDMKSFKTFPNDTESVKKSSSSPTHDPAEELDSSENSADDYMDKSVTECEPELEVCYKESNCHVIKDICMDEGVPTKDKILFENSAIEKTYDPLPESYANITVTKDNLAINDPNLPAREESDQNFSNHDQVTDLMQKDEDSTEKRFENVYKDMVLPGDKVLLQELNTEDSRPSVDKGDEHKHADEQVSGQPESHVQPEESKNTGQEAVLASPALALSVDELNSDLMLLENGASNHQFDPSVPAACGKEECHRVSGCKCNETQNTLEPADEKSDDPALMSQIRHSLGESSFSAVGPVSSRINYSGPVPYSGSISLRSDSSTTSTRSFAFPILQSEWNTSPVRMAKADRRHCRKHRGWRQGLLCCRF